MLPLLDPHIRNLSLPLLQVRRGAAEEMPAQKRARAAPLSPEAEESGTESPISGEGDDDSNTVRPNPPTQPPQEENESDGDGHSTSASKNDTDDDDEYILVDLVEIRKEVQCPICLGIIRKTRKVMECLHRFCRECIDKSMRLGNNECPACRTHCASRRSLRDDPNFDALIAALFPDIDKYEEEELAFHEEEKNRNKKIQDYIAETSRRQSEALSKRKSTTKTTASAFMRKSQGSHQALPISYPNGRCRAAARNASPVVSDDDEEEDGSVNDAGKDSSSADEPSADRKPKRPRQISAQRSSPFRLVGSSDVGSEENNNLEVNREIFRISHLQAGKRELSWGKGGARSQTRHSSTSGLNSRTTKAVRLAKLVEHLRNLDENADRFDVHLTLLPFDEKSLPILDSPYVCCSPTLTISHMCQFIAMKTSVQVEEIEIFARKPQTGATKLSNNVESCHSYLSGELQLLGKEESLVGLLSSFASRKCDLELIYCVNARK